MKKEKCEDCRGTGWYGDNGPGIIGNSEFHECECGANDKCAVGAHPYVLYGGIEWCRICNRQADLIVCRMQHQRTRLP
jgi:hypothetical protein